MKKKLLALVFAGTLLCGSAFNVSADSVTAGDIVAPPVSDAQKDEISNVVDDVIKDSLTSGSLAGSEDVKVEFNKDAEQIVVSVEQPATPGQAASEQVSVSIKLDAGSRTEAAQTVNKAVEEVKAVAAEVKETVAAEVAKLGVPEGANAKVIEDVTVKAIDFNKPETVTAVAKIAEKVAEHTKKSIEAASNVTGSKKAKVSKVETAVIEISRSESTEGGVVALSVTALNSGSTGINIDVARVSSGSQRVYVLHFDSAKNEVERYECTITNGILGFYMPGFSPVAIVVEDVDVVEVGEDVPPANNPPADSNDGASSDTSNEVPAASTVPTSPKTADASVAVIVVIAMMSIAGIAVSKKRMRA